MAARAGSPARTATLASPSGVSPASRVQYATSVSLWCRMFVVGSVAICRPTASATRGLAWLQKGESNKAIKDFDEAIRLEPEFAEAFRLRGAAWFQKGESNKAMKDWIKATQAPIKLGTDPEAAVRGADCVVTDTWVSMGDKDGEHRHNVLKPYQVNAKLMSLAKPDALFMHCLPAHRGEEVTDEVIDGPQSVVFDEAENRLHAQKGILAWCLSARG